MIANIYSDNATNFVGAHRELRDVFLADEFGNIVLRHLAEYNINWHFNPPGRLISEVFGKPELKP
jgi:hypothetical protein